MLLYLLGLLRLIIRSMDEAWPHLVYCGGVIIHNSPLHERFSVKIEQSHRFEDTVSTDGISRIQRDE